MNREFDSDLAPVLLGAVAGTPGRDADVLTGSTPCGPSCDTGGCDYAKAIDGADPTPDPSPIIEGGGSPTDNEDQ